MKTVSRQPSEIEPARIGALSVLPVFLDLAGKRGLRRDAAGERLAATQADAERRQISCALQSPSSGRHNPQIELRRTTELE